MTIQRMEEKDLPQMLALYNDYIKTTTVTFEEEELSLEAFKTRLQGIAKNNPVLVLKEKEEVLGYAYLARFSDRSAYRYTKDLSICLRKDKTHLGYGSLLLTAILKAGKEEHDKAIVSVVTDTNNPSIHFHLRHGFQEEGHLKNVGYKFKKTLGVYYFVKELK